MPIVSSELKFLKSTNSLGGPVTATEIVDGATNNLFDEVSPKESLSGSTVYRCFYGKNTNSSLILKGAQILMTYNTPSATSNMFIGLGSAPINGVEQAITSETVAPVGISYTELVGDLGMLNIGNIPPNGTRSVWLKRVVSVNAEAVALDGVTVSLQGGTTA